jgi:hypothetical protein
MIEGSNLRAGATVRSGKRSPLDATIVNVALPSITQGIKASTDALEWVVSGDRLGYKQMFLTAPTVSRRFQGAAPPARTRTARSGPGGQRAADRGAAAAHPPGRRPGALRFVGRALRRARQFLESGLAATGGLRHRGLLVL